MNAMQLQLSDEERECLQDSLELTLRNLRQEELRTDSLEFKERLREKDMILTRIMERLEGSEEDEFSHVRADANTDEYDTLRDEEMDMQNDSDFD